MSHRIECLNTDSGIYERQSVMVARPDRGFVSEHNVTPAEADVNVKCLAGNLQTICRVIDNENNTVVKHYGTKNPVTYGKLHR